MYDRIYNNVTDTKLDLLRKWKVLESWGINDVEETQELRAQDMSRKQVGTTAARPEVQTCTGSELPLLSSAATKTTFCNIQRVIFCSSQHSFLVPNLCKVLKWLIWLIRNGQGLYSPVSTNLKNVFLKILSTLT